MVWDAFRVLIAIAAAVVIYLLGAGLVRNFANSDPAPSEPDLTTLEDVDYRYICVVCGAQLVLYAAQGGEVPEAPRHCREPMALQTPTS